jgi:hypothetical protein
MKHPQNQSNANLYTLQYPLAKEGFVQHGSHYTQFKIINIKGENLLHAEKFKYMWIKSGDFLNAMKAGCIPSSV